jgi:glycosyltransferase involved in cell wall biosynthesis
MSSINLSIIIPAFNAENYIIKCLNSIFKQLPHKLSFEVIIVNDGSIDNTLNVLNSYTNNHKNIKVISQDNKGAGFARNTGINIAVGDFIWFIDADDYISDKAFKIIEPEINNDFELLAFNFNNIDKNEQKIPVNNIQNFKNLDSYFLGTKSLFLWKHIYKREIINYNNIRLTETIKNIEDFEFNIYYFNVINSVNFVDGNLYNYYYNEDSTSRNKSQENLLKLAKDSETVHLNLNSFIKQSTKQNKKFVSQQLLQKSVIGFFYSLYLVDYNYNICIDYYKKYTKKNMLPTNIKKSNVKFKMSEFIINNKFLFFLILKVKKNRINKNFIYLQ